MFGYVEPDKPELKMREFDIFRGYYCSLCKTIGRCYGQVPRLSLSYDFTFLYILLNALDTAPVGGRRERCVAHPLKKRLVIYSDIFAEYSADMNVILTYYNLKDKWEDEKNIAGGTGMLALGRAFRRAEKKHPKKSAAIAGSLENLSELEKGGCDSVDEAAEPFAALMRELFECGYIKDENQKKILGWMGYHLGRWIYILDAYDDMGKDIRNGSYNPLVRQYGPNEENNRENTKEFKGKIREQVNFNLSYSMSEIEKAYSLLGIEKNKGILDNILYSGLIVKTDKVLQGRDKKNEKESV